MGECFWQAICFDDMAKQHGEQAAQDFWKLIRIDSMPEKFVPGYIAKPSCEITASGGINFGGGSGICMRHPILQTTMYNEFIRSIPQHGVLTAGKEPEK